MERGDCRIVTFVLATIVGSEKKNIYLQDFKDVDFNFTHFASFKSHLQISILGT